MFVVFRTSDTTDGIRDSTVHILYGVFTAITLLAAVTLALLKIPESVENDDREKPGHLKLLGASVIDFVLIFT